MEGGKKVSFPSLTANVCGINFTVLCIHHQAGLKGMNK